MKKIKIFLASSFELKADRDQFEIAINRKNKEWINRGVFLELVVWEDFLDRLSQTRLQDEYNKGIRTCDLFVMLFWTKVGKYTSEEFETAFQQFKTTSKPFIFTYFKDASPSLGVTDPADHASLLEFQQKLEDLGHFQTVYPNIDRLLFHFNQQLEKLATNGFIEFQRDEDQPAAGTTSYQATVDGEGAIAQGSNAVAAGPAGVFVGGRNTGNINTGTQSTVNTGGGAYVGASVTVTNGNFIGRDNVEGTTPADLEPLFAALLATVANQAPPPAQVAAIHQVQKFKTEAAKGKAADDSKLAKIVDGIAEMVPGAVGTIVSIFATPLLAGIVGPVTKFVLDKLRAD